MLNYDRTVILVSFWLIKAFIRNFYLRRKWQTSVFLFFFFLQFSDMFRFCVLSLNVMLCHFIPKGSSTNMYHRHSFTLLWVQRVRVSVEVVARFVLRLWLSPRFMLRLWLNPRLMLAFGLHTVVPSESETLRLMLSCHRTWFWWVSGWLKYVAESANVESAWLIFIYILFKSIAQHLAERVEDVESCSNSYWISGRATAGSKPRDCSRFICDFYFG